MSYLLCRVNKFYRQTYHRCKKSIALHVYTRRNLVGHEELNPDYGQFCKLMEFSYQTVSGNPYLQPLGFQNYTYR